ncbi:hypothetical protein IDH44_15115 [Paenibacillus sp. IB182496]|uniref:Uncharacterized protein n=1 Tax=Paenibacillus sabuli TaxID=2772509 RepID=A0A927BW08_9BACL|nr:hypothetical protein [Paenibacillus sabuli]MBD2846529.1 hypothetical protein [Paenibacillus sabuli]
MSDIYLFRSIRQLTIREGDALQQLHPPALWMMISISGCGVAQIQHQRQLYMLTAQGALLSYEGGEALALQTEPGMGPWRLYYIEFESMRYAEPEAGEADARERQVGESAIAVVERPVIDELSAMAERLHYAAHMLSDRRERALRVQLVLQEILLWWHASDNRLPAQQTTEQAEQAVQHAMELRYQEEWRQRNDNGSGSSTGEQRCA